MQYLKINTFILVITLFFTISCEDDTKTAAGDCGTSSTFTDPRDGKTYNIVQIGSQCWFAENLNYETENSWCYDDNTNNCDVYGRLYELDDAVSACPPGWHVPSNQEWQQLGAALGGLDISGGKMKEAGLAHWLTPNTGATNESGFTALPGGVRSNGGQYGQQGKAAFFWSTTEEEINNYYVIYRSIGYTGVALEEHSSPRNYGFPVRCVRD